MIQPIPTPAKRLNKPIKRQWLAYRRQWLKDHLANHAGFYSCGICFGPVHESVVELDHIQNRSTHPHLRFEDSNIQPVHSACNTGKKINGR